MKLRLFSGLAALALAALLAACAPAAPAEPAPSPGAASPAPTAELPTPVTEEELPALYEAEGYTVTEVRGYLDDFVVEYTYGGSEPRLLDWVFGETGRRVYLTGLDADASYQITGPGEVRFTTGGVSSSTPWKGLPESGTVRVLVDAYGRVPEDAVQTTLDTVETWLDPAEPFLHGLVGERPPRY